MKCLLLSGNLESIRTKILPGRGTLTGFTLAAAIIFYRLFSQENFTFFYQRHRQLKTNRGVSLFSTQ